MVFDWLLFGALAVVCGFLAGAVAGALTSLSFRNTWDDQLEGRLSSLERRVLGEHMASISAAGVEAREANTRRRDEALVKAARILGDKELEPKAKGEALAALGAEFPDVALWLLKRGVKL